MEKLKSKVLSGPGADEGLVRYRIVDLQRFLREEHEISMGISGIWYNLQELNLTWKTGRQRHPIAALISRKHLKKVQGDLIDIQKQHPDKTVEVWFQDEARVGQQGRLTRIWERKESGKEYQKI